VQEEIMGFLDYITHERKYSIHTIEAYSKDLDEFSAYAGELYGLKKIQEITHFHIRSWLTEMLKNNMASSTVKRKVSSLKSFHKFLLKRNLIQSNPMDKVVAPKVKKSLPKFVDQRSLNELIDSIQFDASNIKSVQDRLILLVVYHTGIRRAELINLKEKDVDLLTSSLKVMGKGGKERIIPFSSESIVPSNSIPTYPEY
jgi:integrase/recombinase XerC